MRFSIPLSAPLSKCVPLQPAKRSNQTRKCDFISAVACRFLPGKLRTHAAPLNFCRHSVQCQAFQRCFKMKYYGVLRWLQFCDCSQAAPQSSASHCERNARKIILYNNSKWAAMSTHPFNPYVSSAHRIVDHERKKEDMVCAWQRQMKRTCEIWCRTSRSIFIIEE